MDCSAGNDANDGLSEEEAFSTLAHSASVVAAGDIVYVKSGCTYNTQDAATGFVMQSDTAGAMATGVILYRGYSSTVTDNGVVDVNANDNSLTGCINLAHGFYVFRNFNFAGGSGNAAALDSGADDVKFINCNFFDASTDGCSGDDNLYFDGCSAHGNGTYGFDGDNFMVCINSSVFDNGSYGIRCESGTFGFMVMYGNTTGGITIDGASYPPVIFNSTFDGETLGNAINISNASNDYAPVLINVILHDNVNGVLSAVDYSADPNAHWPIAHNDLFYSNTTDANNFTTGIDAVTGSDPLFTDEAGHDYTLQEPSPADNEGINDYDIGYFSRDDEGAGGGSDTGLPIGSTDKSGGKQ